MNRHDLPTMLAQPDLPARTTEIRMPPRAQGHEARGAREAGD